MLHSLVIWISHTGISKIIADTAWIIPSLQCVHIVAIAFVFTSMAMLDLRLAGVLGRRHSIQSLAKRFLPTMWVGVVILLITGIFLVIGEPSRELLNWVFRTKMLLLATVLVITFISDRLLNGFGGAWDASPVPSGGARAVGVISLLLWVGIIIAGRWIAYSG